MPLTLCAHPFSSCCQKVQVALYENTHREGRTKGALAIRARPGAGGQSFVDRFFDDDGMSAMHKPVYVALKTDGAHPIGDAFPTAPAYRSRPLTWPAFARAVDEARPFRSYFSLRAPNRD